MNKRDKKIAMIGQMNPIAIQIRIQIHHLDVMLIIVHYLIVSARLMVH